MIHHKNVNRRINYILLLLLLVMTLPVLLFSYEVEVVSYTEEVKSDGVFKCVLNLSDWGWINNVSGYIDESSEEIVIDVLATQYEPDCAGDHGEAEDFEINIPIENKLDRGRHRIYAEYYEYDTSTKDIRRQYSGTIGYFEIR